MAPFPQGPFGHGFRGQTKTDSPREVTQRLRTVPTLAEAERRPRSAQSAHGEVEPERLISEVTLEVSPPRHVSPMLPGDVLTAVTSDTWSVLRHGLRTDPRPRPPQPRQQLESALGIGALDHIPPTRSLRLPRSPPRHPPRASVTAQPPAAAVRGSTGQAGQGPEQPGASLWRRRSLAEGGRQAVSPSPSRSPGCLLLGCSQVSGQLPV